MICSFCLSAEGIKTSHEFLGQQTSAHLTADQLSRFCCHVAFHCTASSRGPRAACDKYFIDFLLFQFSSMSSARSKHVACTFCSRRTVEVSRRVFGELTRGRAAVSVVSSAILHGQSMHDFWSGHGPQPFLHRSGFAGPLTVLAYQPLEQLVPWLRRLRGSRFRVTP